MDSSPPDSSVHGTHVQLSQVSVGTRVQGHRAQAGVATDFREQGPCSQDLTIS